VKRIAMVSGRGMLNECCEFSAQFRKTLAHAVAQQFAVNRLASSAALAPFTTAPICLMEFAPVSAIALLIARIHLRLAGAGWQIRFDDGEFLGFFSASPAVALGELLDRLLALFYERLQYLMDFRLVHGAHFFDFFVLDGRLDSRSTLRRSSSFCAHGIKPGPSEFSPQDSSEVPHALNIADREIAREGMVRRELGTMPAIVI